ncbi:phospholipase B1, membrane-associated-like [Antedon mediterranea]|uniref:phospholipase B1, membrane-associated-like n=1 Tax=Antedon mediterranea TaxID=105859 RepID=UPI003AF50CBB
MRIHLYCVLFLLVFSSTSCYNSRWQRFKEIVAGLQEYDEQLQNLNKAGHDPQGEEIKNEFMSDFPCPPSKSTEKPKSVNQLRPGDIDVIAALGDSLTAANGAEARTLIGVLTQFRGVSWSIGGDDDITEIRSLGNVFKYYNPSVYGYSTGTGNEKRANSKFNVAVPGAVSEDMAVQAGELIKRLKNDPNTDFYNDWKIITLFIGGNDLCGWCDNQERFTGDQFEANIKEALDIFHSTVPRALVNVVNIMDLTQLSLLKGVVCSVVHLAICSCAVYGERIHQVSDLSQQYNQLVEKLILSERYDTREDFTVVLQPFLSHAKIPLDKEGNGDLTYFAPDCFHFSLKSHATSSIALWNNMIQPVGGKADVVNVDDKYNCPSQIFPYLYTNLNSEPDWQPRYPEPLANSADSNSKSKMSAVHVIVVTMLSLIGVILILLVVFMRVKVQRFSYHTI